MSTEPREPWLGTPANDKFERDIVRKFVPLAIVAGGICRTGVRIFDRDAPPRAFEERALVPEETYLLEKIGRPGDRNPVSRLLTSGMLDEINMVAGIYRREVALVGPRGTTQAHRQKLFECLDSGRDADRWRYVLKRMPHGVLSTYALGIHMSPTDPQYVDGIEPNLTDSEIAAEAQVRFESDDRDYVNQSRANSEELVLQFKQIVGAKLKGFVQHG